MNVMTPEVLRLARRLLRATNHCTQILGGAASRAMPVLLNRVGRDFGHQVPVRSRVMT